jgi:hypothetical protein
MMEWKDWIAVAALFVACLSLALSFWNIEREQKANIIKSLLGEKESVAYIAQDLAIRGWPTGRFQKSHRHKLLDTVCLAAICEGSGRALALVYSALEQYPNGERQLLIASVRKYKKIFTKYEGLLDLARGGRRLQSLCQALEITTDDLK